MWSPRDFIKDTSCNIDKQTLDFKIHTPDNETIGAWFILAGPYYDSLPSAPESVDTHIKPALTKYPTVLFLHGNSATRAFHARILHYKAFSLRLGANVLAIDYRGFADSTGTPSEPGLVCDARAAWDWLVAEGAKEEDILVVGHSLGTGVASQLGAQLSREGIKCRGVVLLSVSVTSSGSAHSLTSPTAILERTRGLEHVQYLRCYPAHETTGIDPSVTK